MADPNPGAVGVFGWRDKIEFGLARPHQCHGQLADGPGAARSPVNSKERFQAHGKKVEDKRARTSGPTPRGGATGLPG